MGCICDRLGLLKSPIRRQPCEFGCRKFAEYADFNVRPHVLPTSRIEFNGKCRMSLWNPHRNWQTFALATLASWTLPVAAQPPDPELLATPPAMRRIAPLPQPPSPQSPSRMAGPGRFVRTHQGEDEILDVEVGLPTVLQFTERPQRIYLPDEETVTLDIIDEQDGRIVSVTGRVPGTTTLMLWFRDPDAPAGSSLVRYRVRVSEDIERPRRFQQSLEGLETDLNRAFPNSVVSLSYVGSEVLVRGKAKDIEEATQILRIVSRSLPSETQAERIRSLEGALEGDLLGSDVTQTSAQTAADSISAILPLGVFSNPDFFDPDRIEQAGGLGGIARGRNLTGANAAQINSRVVNLLEIAGVHQVQLKVTLAEVVRDAGRSLVTELGIGDSFARPGSTNVDFTVTEGIGQFTLDSNRFFLQVDALKRLGLARSLAEPNLTSLNGQPANFLVGGQFPILESNSTVAAINQTIRYIPFGVQLTVVPTVTDGDRIRLNLQSVVSEQAGGGIAGGIGGGGGVGGDVNNDPSQPPSLSTRAFQTTVELRSSESLAVAGLIRTSLVNNSVRVPFLGDIPVVGNLFTNQRTTYQEQELILVVTPQLVSPIPAIARPPLPGSDTFEPDDLTFFLKSGLVGDIPDDYRTPVRSDLYKMHSFRHAEQKYILGRPGHTSGQALPAPRAIKPYLMELPDGPPHDVPVSIGAIPAVPPLVEPTGGSTAGNGRDVHRPTRLPELSSTGEP